MEKKYRVGIDTDDESGDTPCWAYFSVSRERAARIVALARLVRSLGVLGIVERDSSVSYLLYDPEEEPEEAEAAGASNKCVVDTEQLLVCDGWFHFSANLKDTGVAFSTEEEPVAALAAAFGIAYEAPQEAA